MKKLVSENDLFLIRIAAAMWLKDHKDDPNAEAVKKALDATED